VKSEIDIKLCCALTFTLYGLFGEIVLNIGEENS